MVFPQSSTDPSREIIALVDDTLYYSGIEKIIQAHFMNLLYTRKEGICQKEKEVTLYLGGIVTSILPQSLMN